jgi:hypothetical protein
MGMTDYHISLRQLSLAEGQERFTRALRLILRRAEDAGQEIEEHIGEDLKGETPGDCVMDEEAMLA